MNSSLGKGQNHYNDVGNHTKTDLFIIKLGKESINHFIINNALIINAFLSLLGPMVVKWLSGTKQFLTLLHLFDIDCNFQDTHLRVTESFVRQSMWRLSGAVGRDLGFMGRTASASSRHSPTPSSFSAATRI